MENLTLTPIGKIIVRDGCPAIELDKRYSPALRGLEGFDYAQVLWWFDGCDNAAARDVLTVEKPYTKGPDMLGVFATRSPARPNPIALSTCYVTYVDRENGVLGLAYIDANEGSPVLDIKPYTPSLDRVEDPSVPGWCAHWPKDCASSGDFDWEAEFNF